MRRVLPLRRHQDGSRLRAVVLRPHHQAHLRQSAFGQAGGVLRLHPAHQLRPRGSCSRRERSEEGKEIMYQTDTEMLFPTRVIPALKQLRGPDWKQLVEKV